MNTWFGKERWAICCDYLPHTGTPLGVPCLYCEEPIAEGDQGEMVGAADGLQPIHKECLLRQTLGSVAHQERLCACYGGKQGDPPGMTRRQSAIEAWEHFQVGFPHH